MSDFVPAVQGDDAAAQIVVSGLLEARGAEHFEQGLLVRMHAYGFRQVAIAVWRLPRPSVPRLGNTLKE